MALGSSPRTVEIHRGNTIARLNARSTGDAVRMGLEASGRLSGQPLIPAEPRVPAWKYESSAKS